MKLEALNHRQARMLQVAGDQFREYSMRVTALENALLGSEAGHELQHQSIWMLESDVETIQQTRTAAADTSTS